MIGKAWTLAGLLATPLCLTLVACQSSDDGEEETATGGSSSTVVTQGGGTSGSGQQGNGGLTSDPGAGGSTSEPGAGGSTSEPGAGGTNGAGGGSTLCASGPLETSLPDCQPSTFVPTGDYYQDCVDRINQFRWECQCLPPLTRWTEGEDCADQMAQYDAEADEAHAGFRARICSGGNGQCECPGWGSLESIVGGTDRYEACLAMMWHEVDEPSGEQGHYEAMSSTRYTQVACGAYTLPNGDVWALQNYQ